MMQCGKAIRLTWKDRDDLEALTGFTPPEIRTESDLRQFIERCKDAYRCDTEDSDLLLAVFDRVSDRLLRERLATPLTNRRKKRTFLDEVLFYLRHGTAILFRAYVVRRPKPRRANARVA